MSVTAEVSHARIVDSIKGLTGEQAAGRLAGSAGAHFAAGVIAAELERAGASPAGSRGYHAPVLVNPSRLLRTPRLSIASADLTHRTEFGIRSAFSASGSGSGRLTVMRRGDEFDMHASRERVILLTESYPFDVVRSLASTLATFGARALIIPEPLLEGTWIRKDVAATEPLLPVIALAEEIAQSAQGHEGALVEYDVAVDTSPRHCANIIGAIEGSGDEGAVVLTAHYDHVGDDPSGGRFPGAFDNASGVVVAIEVARRLARAGRRPPRSLVVALLTGEESGLQGARAFVTGERRPINYAVNVDGVGSEPLRAARFGLPTGQAKVVASNAARAHAIDLRFTLGRDDARVFHHVGIPTIGFGQEPVSRPMSFMHTPYDTPERLDTHAMSEAVDVVLGIVDSLLHLRKEDTMTKTMKLRIADLLRSSVGLAAAGDSCCGAPSPDNERGSAEMAESVEFPGDEESTTGGCCRPGSGMAREAGGTASQGGL